MNRILLGCFVLCFATLGSARAAMLTFSADFYPIDVLVNTTHVVWDGGPVTGVIQVEEAPYQTTTNPVTGEVVSRFAFTGTLAYAGKSASLDSGSFVAVTQNGGSPSSDSFALHPVFQALDVSGLLSFTDFHLEKAVVGLLSPLVLPDFDSLNYSMESVTGNLYVPSERATIAFSGHNFAISAVPEPSAYALFVSGLGLIGLMASRRRSK